MSKKGFLGAIGLAILGGIAYSAHKSSHSSLGDDTPDWLGYCPDCPECGTEMKYSYSASEFRCPSCGHTVDQDDLDYDENDDDIPFGCQTCGGPYPSCKTSCTIFDD